ncbi:unnamed protein product [Echinostoma caproni]|uniref:Small muscular protein n=1 Tax=Echinostoma caproni TaxID=27848 RepID=A0A183ARN0_9TREM|nr:unnamed protein product [Echinostoma caproni]
MFTPKGTQGPKGSPLSKSTPKPKGNPLRELMGSEAEVVGAEKNTTAFSPAAFAKLKPVAQKSAASEQDNRRNGSQGTNSREQVSEERI